MSQTQKRVQNQKDSILYKAPEQTKLICGGKKNQKVATFVTGTEWEGTQGETLIEIPLI